jgi:SAM-dependent methyltransferase
MRYPAYQTYQALYARFLKKGPEAFFAKTDIKGKDVADLCCGNGLLSQYALSHGANFVALVDQEPLMVPDEFKAHVSHKFGYHNCSIQRWLKEIDAPFDLIVCRQGVNYWLKEIDAKDLANKLVAGGMFVFNTFGRKPSSEPKARRYSLNNRRYMEVTFMDGDKIHHIQTSSGLEPHLTTFDWISQEEYRDILSPRFKIEEVVDGPSSMYYCTKI